MDNDLQPIINRMATRTIVTIDGAAYEFVNKAKDLDDSVLLLRMETIQTAEQLVSMLLGTTEPMPKEEVA